jgi:carbamoyl-phosphate synthase large subunit
MAVDFDIPLFTNIRVAREFIDAMVYTKDRGGSPGALEIKAWEEYR